MLYNAVGLSQKLWKFEKMEYWKLSYE